MPADSQPTSTPPVRSTERSAARPRCPRCAGVGEIRAGNGGQQEETIPCQECCRHKFIDSRRCIKCGWVPPNVKLCGGATLGLHVTENREHEARASFAAPTLLACPFCGQAPKMNEQFMMRLMADTAQVQCACGCYSPLHNTPAEAAAWWNTRQANSKLCDPAP